MPILPLYGHRALRDRLRDAAARGTLPASLLLHGPRGIGKQRLALWLGQLLLCEGAGERPCGACQGCRYAQELAHPDIQWYFPRPRPKDADPSADEVRADYAEAAVERARGRGLYPPASGSDGIFVATVRAIVASAAMSPALGRAKVYIVGDAERLVPQEANPEAANDFLKLLEEPPADTTIVLTSSEPGALLPTVRSRVSAVRVAPLPDEDLRAFLADPSVAAALAAERLPAGEAARIRLAAGAPGTLVGGGARDDAEAQARRMLDAVLAAPSERYRAAFGQGVSKARGAFSDSLVALGGMLHEQVRGAVERGDDGRALAAARGVDCVERARERAAGNANPQLVTAALLRDLREALR